MSLKAKSSRLALVILAALSSQGAFAEEKISSLLSLISILYLFVTLTRIYQQIYVQQPILFMNLWLFLIKCMAINPLCVWQKITICLKT